VEEFLKSYISVGLAFCKNMGLFWALSRDIKFGIAGQRIGNFKNLISIIS
jgi:hypothetical protein